MKAQFFKKHTALRAAHLTTNKVKHRNTHTISKRHQDLCGTPHYQQSKAQEHTYYFQKTPGFVRNTSLNNQRNPKKHNFLKYYTTLRAAHLTNNSRKYRNKHNFLKNTPRFVRNTSLDVQRHPKKKNTF